MKNTVSLAKAAILLLMISIWLLAYPYLPETMPTHWNFEWKADAFSSKNQAVMLFPIITVVITLLFQFLPKLDPKKDNYPKFEKAWNAFQLSLLSFFLYAYSLTLYASIHPEINVGKYMMIWIWVLFIILWNYMGKIRRNYFIWIRLPWTIENEDVWNKTHRLWWKTFMLAWAAFILNAFVWAYPKIFLILVVSLILIVPIVYSYLEYKKIKNV